MDKEKEMKNHEVELRAFITKRKKENILDLLKNAPSKKQYIKDVYYCPNSVRQFSEVEMDDVGSFSLRLRESKVGSKLETTINMKVITAYEDHNAWDEHEIKINSLKEAQKICVALGFKSFFTLEKHRHVFKYRGMSVNFEEIKDAGSAIEVELITEKSKASEAKQKILDFFEEAGIKSEQIVKKSLTNELMHKLAKF
ncbi:MAG: CYTH domain-containing protein [bacterium]